MFWVMYSIASGATQDGGERSPRGCKKISFLNETNCQEQTDFPESAKFLVATHSTAPKTNLQAVPMMVKSESGGNVAVHDSELLSLEMGWVVLVFFQLHSEISRLYPFQIFNIFFFMFSHRIAD